MEGRIECADGHWMSPHLSEQTVKILGLEGQKLTEGSPPFLFRLRENHFFDERKPLPFKKHMFCPRQTDTLCSKGKSNSGILGRICISPYF